MTMAERHIRAIAVFCGSNLGASVLLRQRRTTARPPALAQQDITLVYGGTTKGLMGIVADAHPGGRRQGAWRHHRAAARARSFPLGRLTRHEIVETLRSRKERMVALADAFIALPGGIGTVEELMVVWSMNQLSEIDKPVGIRNVDDFFSPFLAFIDRMVDAKFLPAAHRHSICSDASPEAF